MSTAEPTISRKEKKALRDAARAQSKGKKRKHGETIADDEAQQPEIAKDDTTDETAVAAPAKQSKKRKADQVEDADATTETTPTTSQPKKRKKKSTTATTGEDGDATNPTNSRFIVFVGNLPYKSTDATLRSHFQSLEPFTLRHRTDPHTKRSKGWAFLEFENYDRMKTCLKLYHHSMLDPEAIEKGEKGDGALKSQEEVFGSNSGGVGRGSRKKKDTARRINVELTSGGGGNTEGRKEKIKVKNQRLQEQRERRAEAERKEREKEEKKKKAGGGGKDKKAKQDRGEEQAGAGAVEAEASHGIHPSRLAQMGR
ncbi:hypothetical protein CLAFUW4_14791 [Fulvia fulva]|uniref:RRM domain-containing protein n=1 Tax=Passalora fulva TaxID=5499 RepID=A0A9Q8UWF8_PASFU|nr:uncharacterized protein CLAFUR5_14616 [Fulvia fulva]KAK4609090.1 hypothetical protein CLAFUR4_14783 [Fulvia fulva]KAK4609823.1 hypothetical protein CLAFUR0_14783 [Fulvia fulva]UJO24953.1 hypothetical protein CLAFUR5_14616 [Fulvia fulva]WPV22918.1 hypothetical protein CLAFUW4_14791 [Fulvia fulva]WPV37823.1 hypothetical protein CLAFUW7_14792 [Fulvia fulva]